MMWFDLLKRAISLVLEITSVSKGVGFPMLRKIKVNCTSNKRTIVNSKATS